MDCPVVELACADPVFPPNLGWNTNHWCSSVGGERLRPPPHLLQHRLHRRNWFSNTATTRVAHYHEHAGSGMALSKTMVSLNSGNSPRISIYRSDNFLSS